MPFHGKFIRTPYIPSTNELLLALESCTQISLCVSSYLFDRLTSGLPLVLSWVVGRTFAVIHEVHPDVETVLNRMETGLSAFIPGTFNLKTQASLYLS